MKVARCKGGGLPILEINDDGSVTERISPGGIREADYFELFRKVKQGKAELLVACPRGASDGKECSEPMVILRLRHPKSDSKRVIRQCKEGKLSRKRSSAIKRVLDVIRAEDLGGFSESPNLFSVVGLAAIAGLFVALLKGGK